MKTKLYLLAMCAIMAGCAEMESANTNDQGFEAKEEVTGSNIPRRKPKESQNVQVYDKQGIEQAVRPLNMPIPGATPGR